jgi:hypothetical protein
MTARRALEGAVANVDSQPLPERALSSTTTRLRSSPGSRRASYAGSASRAGSSRGTEKGLCMHSLFCFLRSDLAGPAGFALAASCVGAGARTAASRDARGDLCGAEMPLCMHSLFCSVRTGLVGQVARGDVCGAETGLCMNSLFSGASGVSGARGAL